MLGWIIFGIIVIAVFLLSGLRVINQYERGVLFTLGKFSGVLNPGLKLIIPIIQTWERVDLRVKVIDVPEQESITKDNITVGINAVLYFKVIKADLAILQVQNYLYAVSQLSQTTMRNIVGEVELDELLSSREKISEQIRHIIDLATDPWGIKVDSVELKDITLAQDMKRVMAKQAEAEREKRAVIIKAEGEVIASVNMAKAARTLNEAQGALHLRTLQAINNISSDQSNTVIFAIPLEVLRAFEGQGAEKILKKVLKK